MLAKDVVTENRGGNLSEAVVATKLAEIAIAQAVFDRVQVDCKGPTEEDPQTCLRGSKVNEVLAIIFKQPETRVVSPTNHIGFGSEHIDG